MCEDRRKPSGGWDVLNLDLDGGYMGECIRKNSSTVHFDLYTSRDGSCTLIF